MSSELDDTSRWSGLGTSADATAKGHRTVFRVTAILERAASEPDGVRLTALAKHLGAPKSSIHSLVRGLVTAGYLSDIDGAYRLGPAVGALLVTSRPTLLDAARSPMANLRAELGETVMLATPVGNSVVYIYCVESTHVIRYSPPLNIRRPMYPTSSGKVLLAYSGPRRQQSYLNEHIHDPDERAAVRAELLDVRQRGAGLNRGETLPDVHAAAAPVLVAGHVVASIAVAGPTQRVVSRLEEIVDAVMRTAAELGATL